MAIVNRLYTAIDDTVTILTLSNASGFPATPGIVQIESEKIHYTVSTPSQLLTLTRGYSSTSAAAHAAGLVITFVSSDEPQGSGDLVGTAPVSIANGTETLAGQSATVSMHVSDSTHDGYLSSANWTTFNAKQDAATVTAKLLTGFVAAAGTVAATDSILTAFNKVVANIATKITSGAAAVKPNDISTTNTDDFTFPHDVSIAGYISAHGSSGIQSDNGFTMGGNLFRLLTSPSNIGFLSGTALTIATAALGTNAPMGIGTTSPHASAELDVTSTTLGFLPPRMTTTQRNAISSPAEGLVIYNTSTHKLNVYTTGWEEITSA